jgi:hypothetical protein
MAGDMLSPFVGVDLLVADERRHALAARRRRGGRRPERRFLPVGDEPRLRGVATALLPPRTPDRTASRGSVEKARQPFGRTVRSENEANENRYRVYRRR